ncbi:chitinase [Streptomyces pinistramenti]|uniref:chitinase n=1 Tax=Streptomyces pinistramenti TaxID=2884812 RepID=UPI001D092218|nr:chitinase [Streptomyces pinistramenti]MCB5910008.1 chitinase [Streptomyces pinistramenti]
MHRTAPQHRHRVLRRRALLTASAAALLTATATTGAVAGTPAGAPRHSAPKAAPPMAAAPYEYLGWGDPQPPTEVMAATGTKWFTLAFVLSDGGCNPAWDGSRPLAGGSDQAAIDAIRAKGGDVVISAGGWSGAKLGEKCTSADALAGAYQKVIDAYRLKALDIDIEDTEMSNATVRQRVVDALKKVKTANPGLVTYVTMGTTPEGPNADGKDLIRRGAKAGLDNDGWVVMPFDFGGHSGTMGEATVSALDGLAAEVKNAYGYSEADAYRKTGVSSMNGHTDQADETVTLDDFRTILAYARTHHLARFAFWAVNRDRACGSGGSEGDSCSGVDQKPYAYTKIVAQYRG